MFSWNAIQTDPPTVYTWFSQSEQVWESTHQHLEHAAEQTKWFADHHMDETPQYNLRNQVWPSTSNIQSTQGCRKLDLRYTGPYKILQRINEVTYKLNLPHHCHITPSFHVFYLKPIINGPLSCQNQNSFPKPYCSLQISNSQHTHTHRHALIHWKSDYSHI